jgi:hypothetical protein
MLVANPVEEQALVCYYLCSNKPSKHIYNLAKTPKICLKKRFWVVQTPRSPQHRKQRRLLRTAPKKVTKTAAFHPCNPVFFRSR